MAKRKDSVADAVQQAMPGWKVVPRRSFRDAAARPTKVDAISPGLLVQQAKVGAAKTRASKSRVKGTKGTKHSQFVTVTPVGQPDNVSKFQKVVLMRDGKIVAQQG